MHSTAGLSPQAASANMCNQQGAAVSQTGGQTCGALFLSDLQARGEESPFSFSNTYNHIKERFAE